MDRRPGDAPFGGRFSVSTESRQLGTFAEVSGLSVEVGVEEVEEGGVNGYVHKLPGRRSWPNLVLKRGVTDTDNLFEWLNETAGRVDTGGAVGDDRVTVSLHDETGEVVRSWTVHGAMPVKWSGPTLAASSSDVASEQLEIAHHGFGRS